MSYFGNHCYQLESKMPDIGKCTLFTGISPSELDILIKKASPHTKSYAQGQMVAFEGDQCTSIGIVLDGSITLQQLLPSGKRLVIENLITGDIFGEVIVFSDLETYPVSVEAAEDVLITYIPKEGVLTLCGLSTAFLNNFIGSLSNKILLLNQKVTNLSLQSPRQKTIHFILESYRKQSSLELKFTISRLEMAEKINLPRPSLSRELMKLKSAGLIDYGKDTIHINNLEKLEDVFNNN